MEEYPDFLLKNLDFLLNVDFVLNNVDFIIQIAAGEEPIWFSSLHR